MAYLGKWEDVQVSQPEDLDDYADDDEEFEEEGLSSRKEKGKSKA